MKDQHMAMKEQLQRRHKDIANHVGEDIADTRNALGQAIVDTQNEIGDSIVGKPISREFYEGFYFSFSFSFFLLDDKTTHTDAQNALGNSIVDSQNAIGTGIVGR